MFNRHALGDMADAFLLEKAEPRCCAILAEYGVSHPAELPPPVRNEILRRAIVETAVVNFPGAGLEGLSHGIQSFTHPAFLPAMERVQWSVAQDSDTLELARGVEAAVVLAAFGLPVAPYDWMAPRILGTPPMTSTPCLTSSLAAGAQPSVTAFAMRRSMSC
jgi:hypothetical protein